MTDPVPRLEVGSIISVLVFQSISSRQTSTKWEQVWTFRLGVERWAKYPQREKGKGKVIPVTGRGGQ
jgi:hypothetical protein